MARNQDMDLDEDDFADTDDFVETDDQEESPEGHFTGSSDRSMSGRSSPDDRGARSSGSGSKRRDDRTTGRGRKGSGSQRGH